MINQTQGLMTVNVVAPNRRSKPNTFPAKKNLIKAGINKLINVREVPELTEGAMRHLKGGDFKNGGK